MDAVRLVGTPASRHAPSKGSISAGSASSARITSSARPSRSAFFTCLMPTTFLDSRCSSTVGHPHVFARQDSRGHTHARMNYSRINEIRQLYLCPEKRNFSIFSAIAKLSPPSAQSPKASAYLCPYLTDFFAVKASQSLRPRVRLAEFCARRRKIKCKSCYPAAPPTGNIPLSPQVWNFCPNGTKIMRAVGLHSPPQKASARRRSLFVGVYIFSSSIISSVTTDSGVTPGSKSR